jgi:hypothetical protein
MKPHTEYEEKQASGKIGIKTYISYFKTGIGYFGSIFVMFLFMATKVLTISSDYWLSEW